MTPTLATVTHWKLRVSFDEPEVAILSKLITWYAGLDCHYHLSTIWHQLNELFSERKADRSNHTVKF